MNDHPCLTQICAIAMNCGLTAKTQVTIGDYKQYHYDVCIFDKNNNPAHLIEYDGSLHYDSDSWSKDTGKSKGGEDVDLAKNAVGEAKKSYIAFKCGLPCIRLNKNHLRNLGYIVRANIHFFVLRDGDISTSNEKLAFEWLNPSFSEKPEDDWETDMGDPIAGTDRTWVEMRWALKAFFRDRTIMPELDGLSAPAMCDIVNTAIPEKCKKYFPEGKQLQPKHIYAWKSEAIKYPHDDATGRPYYQNIIDRIRAEAQRRNNK